MECNAGAPSNRERQLYFVEPNFPGPSSASSRTVLRSANSRSARGAGTVPGPSSCPSPTRRKEYRCRPRDGTPTCFHRFETEANGEWAQTGSAHWNWISSGQRFQV